MADDSLVGVESEFWNQEKLKRIFCLEREVD